MTLKHFLIGAAGAAALTAAAIAAPHSGSMGAMGTSHGSGSYGGAHPMSVPHGSSSNTHGTINPTWHEFGHGAPAVRVTPHRFGTSVLPTPNRWHGDIGTFDRGHWSQGAWHHGRHNGRFGWWWVIGPFWYFYDVPVYPYPDSIYPPDEIAGWWYWCEDYQEYYPYVTDCPSGWERVLPRD